MRTAPAGNPLRDGEGTVPRSAVLALRASKETARHRREGDAPLERPLTLLPSASAAARMAAICGLGDSASLRSSGEDGVEWETGDRE